jgi:aryl-alcohol dehydrogenase-like predicted oxidoreductase
MGMSIGYTSFGRYDNTESSQALIRAADLGITFWDTNDVYGPNTDE